MMLLRLSQGIFVTQRRLNNYKNTCINIKIGFHINQAKLVSCVQRINQVKREMARGS